MLATTHTVYTADYNLPDLSQSWILGNKVENEKGSTLIYIPKGTTKQNAKEFFGVNVNKMQRNAHDTSSFKKGLSQMFPKMKIDLWELDKSKDDLYYEWSAKDNGQEKVHGWGRAFASKNGTVVIGYLTENINDITRARNAWLPVLKEARIR